MGVEDKKIKIIEKIYGPEALQVKLLPTIDGSVSYEYAVPTGYQGVEGITSGDEGLSLAVTAEHTAGHYPDIPVFPGYRTVELGAKLKTGRVLSVANAIFSQMVVPGHILRATLSDDGTSIISRNGVPIATMHIGQDPNFVGAELSGVFLEICAQSIAAAAAITQISDTELFPLILGFSSLTVTDLAPSSELVVVPGTSNLIDTNTYLGSATVYNKMGGSAVAHLEALRFKPLRRQQLTALHKFAQR